VGVQTQLVVYPDEGHHFANPERQADVLNRSVAWFDQYLK
jgi:dipeptidyl aminopeptidase/acylaminoacyl peptidase